MKKIGIIGLIALLSGCGPSAEQASEVVRQAAAAPVSERDLRLVSTEARRFGCAIHIDQANEAFLDRFSQDFDGIRALGVLMARGQVNFAREPFAGFAVGSELCPGSKQDEGLAAAQSTQLADMQIFLRAAQFSCGNPVDDDEMEDQIAATTNMDPLRVRRIMTIAVAGGALNLMPVLDVELAAPYCGGI